MGYFLQACREAGYEVSGIDISEDSAIYVRNELKIPVRTGPIEKIDIPEGTVDIVTMWHFLEHTPDPRAYLERARRWLKSDGLIVVDVPNYAGTDAQKSWERWKGWQLPFHLYHFTPETLKALLARNGFRTIRTKDYLSEVVRERLSAIPVVSLFSRPVARLFSGHSVVALARKEG
jgi:2-polyprenyl-3-methyl-5-hydroxy-6-metoxy-1,4-benzoquinol methylase